MAGPEEMPDVQPTDVKRPSVDIESLQRKKFKTEELPLSPTQHRTIEDLLHAFKKRGGFDTTRKKLWTEFDEGEGKVEFTNLLVELAESEITREPELLSRERGKAATLIEGAVDRSDIYKTVEASLDALASKHLPAILESIREIRREQIGEEAAAREEQAGNKTDEDYAAHVKAKREEREKVWQETLRKQKEAEEEEARRKAEEKRKQRELDRQKEEEERARRREREEQRRAEQRAQDEQREKERQERYERRRREEREKYRDWRDRSRTRDRDSERDRDRDRSRYRRDRSLGHRSDRGLSPRLRDSRRDTSATPKEPTPAPPPPPPPPVDEKSLEEAALQLLLKEGEELAAKARQKPEFDFEEAEAIENGLKPPPTKPKGIAESKFSNTPTKSGSPAVETDQSRRRGSTADERNRTRRRDDSRSRSRRRFTSRFDEDRRSSRDMSARPRDRASDDRLAIRDFREDRTGIGIGTAIWTELVLGLDTGREAQSVTESEILNIAGTAVATGIGREEIGTEIRTGTGTGKGTGRETGRGSETESEIALAMVTAMTIVDGVILGPARALDTDRALALVRGIGSASMTVTVIVIVVESGIKKVIVNVSEINLAPVCPPPRGEGLAHAGDPRVSLISTVMYPQLAIEVVPLVGVSDPQKERSVTTDRALLRLIDIYPAESETVNVRKMRIEVVNLMIREHEGKVLLGGAEVGRSAAC
ncbi:hypothetical protein OAory_01105710 [Aspergillus oryzae]|uniref:BOD1/SHG1 domain-containing protein n=1 Tax=Aspergillus oryzae TaxID=5062 RepID=A0A1S9DJN2_ASPOZ|nr:hypothetical protein OAory_01105710 [Aspergillus oryzae]